MAAHSTPTPPQRFDAILFDLFDTLIAFDWKRLSPIEDAQERLAALRQRSFEMAQRYLPNLEFEPYMNAHLSAMQRLANAKQGNEIEIRATERFGWIAESLGLGGEGPLREALEAALEAHFDFIVEGVGMPNEYPEFLRRLRGRYKIGLVSNFDHSPAVWKILDKFGVRDLFDTVVISADLGWRKPHPRLYETALTALGAAPHRTLFVGDTPKADVLGPKRLGLAAAWVRSGDGAFPADYPQPDLMVDRIDELAGILLP